MPLVYPRGMVSVSSLGNFSSVRSLSKPSNPSLPISLRVNYIQDYFNNKRRRNRKSINP